MKVQKYQFTLHHDDGKTKISTMATSEESARKMIAIAENCPESSLEFSGTKFEKTHTQLWIDTGKKRTQKFVEMMDYICSNYQHCLQNHVWYTADDFAEKIAEVYSLDNHQNKAVYNFLKSL